MCEIIEIIKICVSILKESDQLLPIGCDLLNEIPVIIFEDVAKEEGFEDIWDYIVGEGDVWLENVWN